VNHLLIHCEYASDLWRLVLNLFGVSWAMPCYIGYQESYSCFLNVEHLKRKESGVYLMTASPTCFL
jgi:hypothetical protein